MAPTVKKPKEKGVPGRLLNKLLGYSFATRMTVLFALIATMTAFVAMGVLSYVWEQHFQAYTRENVEQLAEVTAESIAHRYEEINVTALQDAKDHHLPYPDLSYSDVSPAESAHSVQPGMGVQVVTGGGKTVLYDSSRTLEAGEAPEGARGSGSFAPDAKDEMAVAPIVLQDGTQIGSVRVWVYGSDLLLSKADQTFRDQSYQAMMLAALISIVLAAALGSVCSRAFTEPISRITRTAVAIREGDLSARTNLEGEDEIADLGKTFDSMAESVEANQQLERRLTMDVAHELRTPLMAIQSTIEAIVDGVFEPDSHRLNTINAEVQRLSRLVNAILKLSRLENRSTPMKEEVVNVGELVRPLVMSHEAFVNDAGLTLEFEAEDEVMVYGDPDMIRQATANLISNAVRYTPAPGSVKVKVRKGDIMASIAVQDTGIGLSPEERKMVFNRFWRAEESRERQSGGLGVGLAVVKEIVDRHGGWVQVEGKKGEGACFTIHIPLYDFERIKALREKREGKEKGAAKSGPLFKRKSSR